MKNFSFIIKVGLAFMALLAVLGLVLRMWQGVRLDRHVRDTQVACARAMLEVAALNFTPLPPFQAGPLETRPAFVLRVAAHPAMRAQVAILSRLVQSTEGRPYDSLQVLMPAPGGKWYVAVDETGRRYGELIAPPALAEGVWIHKKIQVEDPQPPVPFSGAAPLLDSQGRIFAVLVARFSPYFWPETGSILVTPLWVIFWAGLGLTALLVLLLSRTGKDSLADLKENLRRLASGQANISAVLEAGRRGGQRELAELITGVLRRYEKLGEALRKNVMLISESSSNLASTAKEISNMAGEVSTTIQQVAKGTEDQSTRTSELHQIINEVSQSATGVKDRAGETSQASSGASGTAKSIHDLAQQAVTQMGQLSSSIENAASVVFSLGDKSQQIGNVVDIIRSIADQTNLLALNAAIEAARAGERQGVSPWWPTRSASWPRVRPRPATRSPRSSRRSSPRPASR